MVYLDKKLTLIALKKIHSYNKYLLSTCYLTGLHRAYSLMRKEN